MRFLARLLYSLLMYALWPVWLVVTLMQAHRRDAGWRFIAERMGWRLCFDEGLGGDPSILWFHAASVGELRSIFPLLAELATDNSLRFVVTSNTPESFRELERFIVQNNFSQRVFQQYCAIDFYFSVHRMVRNINCKALFVVETELWMNLFLTVKDADKYIGILNGRLSNKTLGANGLVRSFYARILESVEYVAARSAQDAKAFVELGANKKAVEVIGNLKRVVIEEKREVLDRSEALVNSPYVLALSTRDGEEAILWDAWKQIESPPLLVIAPRHIRRSSGVESALQDAGAVVAVRSKNGKISSQTDVYLADTMGDAEWLVKGAEWVFVGGSLVNYGGHNVLEPAQWGKRVVCGPYVENVLDDVQWLESAAVLEQIANIDDTALVFSKFIAQSLDFHLDVPEVLSEASNRLLQKYIEVCRSGLG